MISDHFRLQRCSGHFWAWGWVSWVSTVGTLHSLFPPWRGPSPLSYLQPCPQRGIALSRPGCCMVTLSLPTSHTRGQGCSSGGEAYKIRDRDAHTLEVAWCLNLGSIHFRCLGIGCHVSRTCPCVPAGLSPQFTTTHTYTQEHTRFVLGGNFGMAMGREGGWEWSLVALGIKFNPTPTHPAPKWGKIPPYPHP